MLSLGLRTVRNTTLWSDCVFLILDNMPDDIILGMDWEERMGVTRFLPARMLGLSTTTESRATFMSWSADLLATGRMRDVPAEVCTHLIPFILGTEEAPAFALRNEHVAQTYTETPREGTAEHATARGVDDDHVPQTHNSRADDSKSGHASSTSRVILRSVRSFTVPPQSEMGPIEARINTSAVTQRGAPL